MVPAILIANYALKSRRVRSAKQPLPTLGADKTSEKALVAQFSVLTEFDSQLYYSSGISAYGRYVADFDQRTDLLHIDVLYDDRQQSESGRKYENQN